MSIESIRRRLEAAAHAPTDLAGLLNLAETVKALADSYAAGNMPFGDELEEVFLSLETLEGSD